MDLSEAISSRRVVAFTYGGHPRVVIPAAYGRHVSTGNLVLRGYQIGGTSSSRTVPFWTLFSVDKIVSPHFTGEVFAENPTDYKIGDADISPIFSQL